LAVARLAEVNLVETGLAANLTWVNLDETNLDAASLAGAPLIEMIPACFRRRNRDFARSYGLPRGGPWKSFRDGDQKAP